MVAGIEVMMGSNIKDGLCIAACQVMTVLLFIILVDSTCHCSLCFFGKNVCDFKIIILNLQPKQFNI